MLISIHENEDPIFGMDTIPFLASSYADVQEALRGAKAPMAAKLDSQGLMLLYAVPWGPQGLYAKKDINYGR